MATELASHETLFRVPLLICNGCFFGRLLGDRTIDTNFCTQHLRKATMKTVKKISASGKIISVCSWLILAVFLSSTASVLADENSDNTPNFGVRGKDRKSVV